MIKIQRIKFLFVTILLQSALAIAGGFIVYLLTSDQIIPANVYVMGTAIGQLPRQEAIDRIDAAFAESMKSGSLKVLLNGKSIYEIKYSDIGAKVNSGATADLAEGKASGSRLLRLASLVPSGKRYTITPVIDLDSSKLREKIAQLSNIINKSPVDAKIYISGDTIVKEPGADGYKLNEYQAFLALKDAIAPGGNNAVTLNPAANREIQILPPKVTLSDFNGIDEIISSYSTHVSHNDYLESVKTAVKAINGRSVSFTGSRDVAEEFSFNKCLESENAIVEKNDEGYNQVASTLYAALLSSGIQPSSVSRFPHKNLAEYIEPGLDAKVYGRIEDLKFKNTYGSKLAVFASLKDNELTVVIAGRKQKDLKSGKISSETVQVFDPSVIYVENRQLNPGEKKTVSAGVQGVKVNVYRDGDLLHTDTYEAVSAVVHIGPSASWESGQGK